MAAANYGPSNGKGNYNGNGNGVGRASKPDTAAISDRLPPQNLEAEKGVLGSVLLDNDVLHEVVAMLSVDDFYRDTHQTIYQAIRDLYDQGKGIDAVTLADELTRRDQFEKIGGDEALREIVNSVPHAANARYYAAIVRERSISRQLIDMPPRSFAMDIPTSSPPRICWSRPSARSSPSPRTRSRATRSN